MIDSNSFSKAYTIIHENRIKALDLKSTTKFPTFPNRDLTYNFLKNILEPLREFYGVVVIIHIIKTLQSYFLH